MVQEATANLSPACSARGLRYGVVAVAAALISAVILAKLGVPWAARLLLLVPFYMAANGFLQGLYGT